MAVLRYPGAKWNIAPQLVNMIPEHHSYVEPYCGSAAMLFSKSPSNIETINDIDSNVTNLFRCIQLDPERLGRMVMTTPFSREIYEKQFTPYYQNDRYISDFQKATQFLIRTWQGYGIRTCYKAGWKNDVHGRERMYALWDWYKLPEEIIETAERLRQVQIENRPALEVIDCFNHEDVFMYIDPPYLLGTRAGKQYKHEMTDEDHEELLGKLLQNKAKIMLSGYESDMYNEYLKDWNKVTFNSCAEGGKPRKEVVWMNYSDTQMTIWSFLEG